MTRQRWPRSTPRCKIVRIVQDQLTANYQGFEDFIQRPGKVREDLQQIAGTGIVTPAATDVQNRTFAEFAQDAKAFNDYLTTLPALNAKLKSGGYDDIPMPKPMTP